MITVAASPFLGRNKMAIGCDLVGTLQAVVASCHEWRPNIPLCAIEAGIEQAFDNVFARNIATAATAMNLDLGAVAALLAEGVGLELLASYGSVSTGDDIAYNGPIRQGSP